MTSARTWKEPPASLALRSGEIHAWRAALDVPPRVAEALGRTLTPDERARAGRFRSERDRRRFTVARGVLREILARYVGGAPGALQFAYDPPGKPALCRSAIAFNVSHSAGIALYAIADARPVGIDVEHIQADVATDALALRFFSYQEAAGLAALDHQERVAAFYRVWTRKEAYVKARGLGLSLRLDAFDVPLGPGEPAALLASRDDPVQVSRWKLANLPTVPGYAAALAVEGREIVLRCWQWSREVLA